MLRLFTRIMQRLRNRGQPQASGPTPQQLGRVWRDGESVQAPVVDGYYCCPNCHSNKFLFGPSGGICTNVICTNCHSKWNGNDMGFDWQYLGQAEPEFVEVQV